MSTSGVVAFVFLMLMIFIYEGVVVSTIIDSRLELLDLIRMLSMIIFVIIGLVLIDFVGQESLPGLVLFVL